MSSTAEPAHCPHQPASGLDEGQGRPLLTLRAVVVLLLSVLAGVAVAVLTLLSQKDGYTASLAGLGAGTVTLGLADRFVG